MRAITVRKEFSALRDFTTNLPQTFEREGLVIHNSRNVIKKIVTNQGTLVVKNFAGMYFFNRLAYSLFRKSKAARSYQYSAILNDKGIKTPPHVGWIDCYSMGLLTRSYFVSVFYPYRTLDEMIRYYDIFDPSLNEGLIEALAVFIQSLHLKGIYHEDLSVGNILVIRNLNGYDFALVDLNRIKFRHVTTEDGIKNFATLLIREDHMNALIRKYAKLRGQDAADVIASFWSYKKRKSQIRRLRKSVRRYTLTPLESLFRKKH